MGTLKNLSHFFVSIELGENGGMFKVNGEDHLFHLNALTNHCGMSFRTHGSHTRVVCANTFDASRYGDKKLMDFKVVHKGNVEFKCRDLAQKITVHSVGFSGMAIKNGVQLGSEIVAVNGRWVGEFKSLDDVMNLLCRRPVTVYISKLDRPMPQMPGVPRTVLMRFFQAHQYPNQSQMVLLAPEWVPRNFEECHWN